MSKAIGKFIYDNNTDKTRAFLQEKLEECCPSGTRILSSKNTKYTTEYTLTIEGEEDELFYFKMKYE